MFDYSLYLNACFTLVIDRYRFFRADTDTDFFPSALADSRYADTDFLERYCFFSLNLHHKNYTDDNKCYKSQFKKGTFIELQY